MVLATDSITYPDSDGQPMADNTKQFYWIVLIKNNLDCLFADRPDVFVAGDLLWYPVQGEPKQHLAPDVLVAFGRPKGDRGYYKQWEEDNIAPQVVFEILSPGNTESEMANKLLFYDRHGVEEYYIYDPDREKLTGYQRDENLQVISNMQNWISPRLGIRFHLAATLELFYPNGTPFRVFEDLSSENERLRSKLRELGIDPDFV